MCTAIQSDRTLKFDNLTRECLHCEDGKNYIYTETCKNCDGKKKFLKNGRRYKCKTCKGRGYTMLAERVHNGDCNYCKGTRAVPLTAYDDMTHEDREWIFENLFNFEKPYTKHTSSFNEGYLGIGIVCGVTDYGRYKKMSASEFKEEVKNSFMRHYLQYVSITNKQEQLPKEILIKRGESGWFAYPVYQTN